MKKSTFGERIMADISMPFGVNKVVMELDGVVEDDEDDKF